MHEIWKREPLRLLDELSEPERNLLAECVYGGSRIPNIAQLNAKYGYTYSFPYYGGFRDCHFIHCFFQSDRMSERMLVDGISGRLKELLPPPSNVDIRFESETPRRGTWRYRTWRGDVTEDVRELAVYESESIGPREARRVLQLTAVEKIRVSDKTGLPSKAAERVIGEALHAPDPGFCRAAIWPVLIQQCGWAKARSGKLRLTPKGKSLLDDFSFAKYADGVNRLVGDTGFDEMWTVSVIKGQLGRQAGRFRYPPVKRREAIVEALFDLPAGGWVELEEAYRFMRAKGTHCHVVGEGIGLYIGHAEYGHLSGSEEQIGRVYFRQFAGASLATLGMLDLALTDPDYI
ncbi:MAG: hypothetical protein AAF492_27185, partial [Verrucomicrobiota bacterium]